MLKNKDEKNIDLEKKKMKIAQKGEKFKDWMIRMKHKKSSAR